MLAQDRVPAAKMLAKTGVFFCALAQSIPLAGRSERPATLTGPLDQGYQPSNSQYTTTIYLRQAQKMIFN
jgi:hypothetical protein